MLMNRENSLLLIIDIQERLTPAMDSAREVITNSTKLVELANELKVPFIINEQYPKGLGSTMFDIKSKAGEKANYIEKISFSSGKDEATLKAIKKTKKKQIIIAGIETHICVLQSAIDLKEAGYEVFLVADACSSRAREQNIFGLQRMMQNGIQIVTFEMVFFEWFEKAGSPEFKELSKKLVK
ncbi:MAG: isochorismatase family protein [Lactobacillus sp.]|jgi:nicotinamidase-related amidase|nr:isochorismatase family protein [Lactobacillus sp.]